MDSELLLPLLTTPGPFTSIYFEDSHDTADAAAQLDLKWRGLRDQLVEQGATESVTAKIECAVMDLPPPIGRSGRGVVAGANGVVLNEHLLRPTATPIVRVSELPYVVPIVEHGLQDLDYLVVAADHTGADISVHGRGWLRPEAVDGGGRDAQLRTDEDARKNLRAVADRVSELVDAGGTDAVFVVGEVRSRSDLLATLSDRVKALVVELRVGARHSGHDFDEVQQAIEAALLKRRLAVIDNAAQRFTAEVGRQSGLAAEGLGPVCSGLRQGAVDTLIIGDIGEETVVADDELTTVAPNAEVLSEQGAAAARTLRADEALPMFAISVGASLVRTDERISPAGGIGAVLRYAPTLR
jgi:peptide chain release factor subunit 1